MIRRQNIDTGTAWEPVVGYSRAVRVGPIVEVSGTTSTGPDGAFVDGDAAAQARQCLENIRRALHQVGAAMPDVIRTRIFVTDISQWEAIGRVHGDVFDGIRPATSMVQVNALIDPRMVVEIEASAYITPDPRP